MLIQFDKSINNALATRVKTKLHFKVEIPSFCYLSTLCQFLTQNCFRLRSWTPIGFVTTCGLSCSRRYFLLLLTHLFPVLWFLMSCIWLELAFLTCRLSSARTASSPRLTEWKSLPVTPSPLCPPALTTRLPERRKTPKVIFCDFRVTKELLLNNA